MRKIREVLRLYLAAALSIRAIAGELPQHPGEDCPCVSRLSSRRVREIVAW